MESDSEKASTSVIDNFILYYPLQRPFFKKTAKYVMRDCQNALKDHPHIRANFSCRAKKTSSLHQKLRKIQDRRKEPWKNAQEIWDNIYDMAGVRIALYLPSQSYLVERILKKMIKEKYELHRKISDAGEWKMRKEIERIREVKDFGLDTGSEAASVVNETSQPDRIDIAPSPGKASEALKPYEPRFQGYNAKHYLIKVVASLIDGDSDNSDNESEKRSPKSVGAEIQIVSASTHIWAEIEHDIEYKKKNGAPSTQEQRLLDGFQGIMNSAEVFLEQLEETYSDRIAALKKKFADVADLISFLKARSPIFINGGGGVRYTRQLLEFLRKFDKDSGEKLGPILDNLNGLESSNAKLLRINQRFCRFKLRPPIYVIESIFTTIKTEKLQSAYEDEEKRDVIAGLSLEAYRCRVLIDCLMWFIADLFEPLVEVHDVFREKCRTLSTRDLRALQWAADGAGRIDILSGEKAADAGERQHINDLWQWFLSCEEPMMKFAFSISRLGIRVPRDLSHIRNHRMYQECLDLDAALVD